jgi:hypothetical protein
MVLGEEYKHNGALCHPFPLCDYTTHVLQLVTYKCLTCNTIIRYSLYGDGGIVERLMMKRL